jgi:hypothetical protein
MPYTNRLIKIDKLSPEARTAVDEVATHFNAHVEDANTMQREINSVIGDTVEAKAEMKTLFEKVRFVVHFLHSKRFQIGYGTFFLFMVTKILQSLGVDTTELGPIIKAIVEGLVTQ